MKRIASKGFVFTVLAVLGMSGPAAAFTPVPIPTPRTVSTATPLAEQAQAQAITRLEQ